MDEDGQMRRDAGSRERARLWRAWRTVHEMVQDRGYVLSEMEVKVSLEDFTRMYSDDGININKNKLIFTASPSDEMMRKHADPPTERDPNPGPADIGPIFVRFEEGDSVGIKQMRKFAHDLEEGKFQAGIFVTSVPVTPSALKVIPALKHEANITLEVFEEKDLLVNITHHELVPKHVLLSKEEKMALLKRYRLKETQLPRIQQNDPVAKYLGLKRLDVVKIIRKSETAGRYASYRVTV